VGPREIARSGEIPITSRSGGHTAAPPRAARSWATSPKAAGPLKRVFNQCNLFWLRNYATWRTTRKTELNLESVGITRICTGRAGSFARARSWAQGSIAATRTAMVHDGEYVAYPEQTRTTSVRSGMTTWSAATTAKARSTASGWCRTVQGRATSTAQRRPWATVRQVTTLKTFPVTEESMDKMSRMLAA
jgi:hypothetical protein